MVETGRSGGRSLGKVSEGRVSVLQRGNGKGLAALSSGWYSDRSAELYGVRPGSYWVSAGWSSFLVNGDPAPGVDMVKKTMKI